ncbi:MAG: 30S ribosomal protein S12 methylthiotransferase RimO [Candidatus Competibacterales bacterium]
MSTPSPIPIPPAGQNPSPCIGFISLGCPKALVDSERILTQLRTEGYRVVPSFEDAQLVVINTCGFIDAAVEESLAAIGEALEAQGRVIGTGCLGTQAELITRTHPGVLAVTGPQQYEAVVDAVHRHLPPPPHRPLVDLVPPQGIKLTPRHYAYLKISEGCNHRCSFCIIPSLRGALVSRPIGEVMGEAERLVAAGVRELLIISQDTSAYGVDRRYATDFWGGRPLKTRFVDLCRALGELPAWVRLHYVYPYPHVDEVLPLMAEGGILPYLDIPFQHASERVLRAMRRPAAAEKILDRLAAWRAVCPDIAIRSTFIVGFPGETEADFETLLAFLRQARLDRVGCFCYSPVAGAAANALPDPVPETVKEERRERLMALQAEISAAKLAARVGQRLDVMVDEVGSDGAVGRSYADAPEIDGQVFLTPDDDDLCPGDIIEAEVVAADDHDLVARPVVG